jgi:anthranilate/para-aminobenzoate synthase component II
VTPRSEPGHVSDALVQNLNRNVTVFKQELYKAGKLRSVVISPGPGHPRTDSGVCRDVITWAMGKIPVLGVCMGLECIVDLLGGDVSKAIFDSTMLCELINEFAGSNYFHRSRTQVKSCMAKPL